MKKEKVLIISVVILSVLVLFQAGYIIGKNKAHNRPDIKRRPGMHKSLQSAPILSGSTSQGQKPSGMPPSMSNFDDEWDPFLEMQRMQKMMNRMFNNSFTRASMFDDSGFFDGGMDFDPDIDVQDQGEKYIIKVDLPGVDKDTINIDVKPNAVTISGERVIETQEDDTAQGLYRSERSFGSFSRTIPLYGKVKVNEVEAKTSEGVLVIVLPKEESAGSPGMGTKVKVQ